LINIEGGLDNNVLIELELGTKERGLLVDWAPQEEVLAHPAVGGFFDTLWLEFYIGMCVYALLAVDSCVSKQLGIGLDINGTFDRLIVEKMVKNVMENQIEGITSFVNEIAEKAQDSIKETGSSYCNIENLVKDIRSMKIRK
ncbi:7-deoxyloganetic acid glucosyltransferase, partial [Mucuna pruriens]